MKIGSPKLLKDWIIKGENTGSRSTMNISTRSHRMGQISL